jgi:hypothetical protein
MMVPDASADLDPIVAEMNDLLGVEFLGRPMMLEDFAHVGETGHPLSQAATIVWVRALHYAVTYPPAAAGIAETWDIFGDLLIVRLDPVHGPVYVAKRSASEQDLHDALDLLAREPGEAIH